MNICMLVSNYLPHQGGAEYAVHHLTTALLRLGHKVVVLMENDSTATHLRYPYPVFQSLRIPLLSSGRNRWLHACLMHRRHKFDVMHIHIAWPAAGFVAARMKKHHRLPIVITPHGGDVQVLREIDYGLCLTPSVAAKVVFTLSTADLVTAVSKRMRTAVAERGVDPGCVRDIGYGTEFDAIQNLRTDNLRRNLGLSEDDFVVLSVGRNSRVKDIPTLIEGLRIAAANEPRLKCILVGPDESIRQLVEKAGLTDRVKILGRIPSGYDPKQPGDVVFQTPYPELIAAYRACDVYVSTSHIESFNTSALDAFACGKPVIITNTQGFMDLLEERVNGHSIPPRDPGALAETLLVFARDRDLCHRMGEAARLTARQYDWQEVARRYVGVYEEAIGSVRSR